MHLLISPEQDQKVTLITAADEYESTGYQSRGSVSIQTTRPTKT